MIQSIRLQNFRSYSDESFEFDKGVNIVVGPNASGKTNLLEAVLVLAQGNSYRAKDSELIKFEKPWARLDGFFDGGHNRVLKINKLSNLIHKEFLLDSSKYNRLNLDRSLPVVFFEPQHLQLITRGPEGRRDYFDDLLIRSQPGFKTLLNNYRRTLSQRNALLKKSKAENASQLFAWNIRLSELAGQIVLQRLSLLELINQVISKSYSAIAKRKSVVNFKYSSGIALGNYSTSLLKKLETHLELDRLRGFTGFGPHREDVLIYFNNQLASLSASRGEIRSLLLALKIFELKMLEASRGHQPIFLLDDVFSELDSARRRALVAHLKNQQTIITTTDADAVLEYFAGRYNLIPLSRKR